MLNKLEAIISIHKLCRDLTKENKTEELKMTLTTNSCDIYKYFQQQQFAVDHLRNEWKIVADGVADPPPPPPPRPLPPRFYAKHSLYLQLICTESTDLSAKLLLFAKLLVANLSVTQYCLSFPLHHSSSEHKGRILSRVDSHFQRDVGSIKVG